ncbi:hypothetical protein FZEAL_2306 [Fusarium zealandicum]|uniref:Uncharacterized protein n=1 Tax=Fusarium zealandicum TaxID=1053134 RepID=A0A8H4UR46_9HYPO|nr:hypothetical protein FZEAL_2306 [Fusarium zealandicum]
MPLATDKVCLVDNRLLIDPVVAVIPDRSDQHHQLRRMIRPPIFKALAKRAQEGYIILMTACLVDKNQRDAAFLEEHLDIAHGADVLLFWIDVHCDTTASPGATHQQPRALSRGQDEADRRWYPAGLAA